MRILAGIVATIAMSSALHAAQPLTKAGLPLGDEPDPYSPAVSRMISLIALYTRWPASKETLRACIVPPADHAGDIREVRLASGEMLRPASVSAQAATPGNCDIVYLGRLSLAEQREVTERLRGSAVLTIAENDPACRSRAMFCLLFQSDSLSFRLNIDSVSRSQVRVDPRVLRMGLGESP